MRIRMTLMIISFCLLSSQSVAAYQFQNEACEVNLNGSAVLADGAITITDENDNTLTLSNDGSAVVNKEALVLGPAEKAQVKAYVEGIESTVPMVIQLAADAIDLTNYALTEVFTGLLGEDSRLPGMVNEKLEGLKQHLESKLYQTPNTISFDGGVLNMGGEEKSDFERQIETAVEEMTANAMAEMFVLIGKSILSGDGEMTDLENRVENLSTTIEQTVETESQKLKDDALAICEAIEILDVQENALNEIQGLQSIDLFTVKSPVMKRS